VCLLSVSALSGDSHRVSWCALLNFVSRTEVS
jgi:hypothetical protein